MKEKWIKRLDEIEYKFCKRASYLSTSLNLGLKVPQSYVISDVPIDNGLGMGRKVLESIETELSGILDESKYYSIRCSKINECGLSVPGQVRSRTPSIGSTAIARAIGEIWQNSAKATSCGSQEIVTANSSHTMCLMIQEVINAKFSGAAFTINPITGKNEIIVEAFSRTPHFPEETNSIPSRWVFKGGKCIQKPANVIPEANFISHVAEKARRISQTIGKPVSLEWAYDGEEIFWLQIDEIKNAWRPVIYSNKISRELLPGMIKPLVWSINVPVVNSSWKRFFKELTGPEADNIQIENLARSFYYRAYFNMSVVGDFFEIMGMSRDALELLFGSEKTANSSPIFRPDSRILKHLPRMIAFSFRMLFFNKQIEIFLRKKSKQFKSLERLNTKLLDVKDCISQIDTLIVLARESSFLVIITQLLNSIYNWFLRKNLEKTDIDISKIKFEPCQIDCSLYLSQLNSIYKQLPQEKRNFIQEMQYTDIINNSELRIFGKELERFLNRFGHLSDNANDFSKTTWKENPKLVTKIIADFGYPISLTQNYEKRKPKEQITKMTFAQKFLFLRVQQYHIYRELVGFVYNFGFGLFRKFFLRIGEILSNNGSIESKEDIFYLTYKEIRNFTEKTHQTGNIRRLVDKRKAEMNEYQNLKLPEIIFDDLPKSLLIEGKTQWNLKGIATSRGSYVGTARVIAGIHDFYAIRKGDVLIIPSSDPSWTPLFSKAGAVVSESGGMLSHCSIIAREYGIPAVVSVKGALQIKSGSKVVVDGYRGEVNVLEE
jgi:phosphohistidine swiveling domain-containing protein